VIIDANLCTATDTINLSEPGRLGMTLIIPPGNTPDLEINCAGDTTGYIEVVPGNFAGTVSYLWSDGIITNPRVNLAAGDYRVIITDSNGCVADSTITLDEPDSLRLVLNVTPPYCPDLPDGEITLTVSGGVIATDYTYLWSDNSTTPSLANVKEGHYKVTVTDLNGCSIRDSVYIEPENEICLNIPNAISPNGDWINDVWNIGLRELYPEMEVKIFNRWGMTIWTSAKGYPLPWDGTSNGSALPIDSYHYIIDLHNGSKPIVGNVTIVR